MRYLLSAALVLTFLSVAAVSADEHQPGKTLNLLKSQDLADWDFFLVDPDVKKEEVWSFNDQGHLVCKGVPMGYLCTKCDFQNLEMVVEWRWPEKPSNSGVLMRISGDPKPLPHCVEAQLQSGNAGDIWAFQDFKLDCPPEAVRVSDKHGVIRGAKKKAAMEKEPGEWNTYVIRLKDGDLRLKINGETVNQATGVETTPGRIGFQSEGGPIEFRKIEVTPIK